MKQKTGKNLKCLTCGTYFYAQKYEVKRRKFCSLNCRRHTKKTKKYIKERMLIEWKTTRKNQKTKNYPNQIIALQKAMAGKNNPQWEGNNVKKQTIHQWVKKRLPKPSICPHCKKRQPYDLANINNHIYKKNIKHFIWLCRKCHMKLDGRKPPLQYKIDANVVK